MRAKRLYLSVCALIGLLAIFAVASTPWLQYCVNLTTSLPGTLYVVHKGAPVKTGDLVAFRWKGGGFYPLGSIFIKRVSGSAGDTVKRVGNGFWVSDRYVGQAKTVARDGIPLVAATEGVIGANEYFVSTPNPDSLDSRYALCGNVKQDAIVGRAYAIF